MKRKYKWNYKKCFKNLGIGLLKVVGIFVMLCVLGAGNPM